MSYGFKASLNFLLATKYFSFRMALIAPLNRTYIGMHYAGVYIVHFYQPLAPIAHSPLKKTPVYIDATRYFTQF